jgi:hypothetical protein
MQIVLVRHGKVAFDYDTRVSRLAFVDRLAKFNAASIAPDSEPSAAVRALAKGVTLLVCSNLARAVASAHKLDLRRKVIADGTFREAEVPSRQMG